MVYIFSILFFFIAGGICQAEDMQEFELFGLTGTSVVHARRAHAQEMNITPEYIDVPTANPAMRHIPCLYQDNGSTTLLVLGQGFPGGKAGMLIFASLFSPEYDIVMFDYRFSRMSHYLLNPRILIHPFDELLLKESDEVREVVKYFSSHKNYEQIVGLGECYSNFTFLAAQAKAYEAGERLFDKLILDSAWLSIRAFAESISFDPCLPLSPQSGGMPKCIKRLLACAPIHNGIGKVLDIVLPDISILPLLKRCGSLPLLFIYGREDLMVLEHHFDDMWKVANEVNQKCQAFITPYRHSDNLHNKRLYKAVCQVFINNEDISTAVPLLSR